MNGLTGALMATHAPSVSGSDESTLDGLASAYYHAPGEPTWCHVCHVWRTQIMLV